MWVGGSRRHRRVALALSPHAAGTEPARGVLTRQEWSILAQSLVESGIRAGS